MSLPVSKIKEDKCSNKFDTYNGEQLFYRLKLNYIEPPKERSLFSGMFPSGNQWSVSYFTKSDKYKHEGGWCWGENPDLWAEKVNEDLFNKRITENPDKYLIRNYWQKKNNPQRESPPDINIYLHLNNGQNVKPGDFIKVRVIRDYYRAESYELFVLFGWDIRSGGNYPFNNFHWHPNFYHQDIRVGWTHDQRLNIDLTEIISSGTLLERKSENLKELKLAYGSLTEYGRAAFRKIHKVKGGPKFEELIIKP